MLESKRQIGTIQILETDTTFETLRMLETKATFETIRMLETNEPFETIKMHERNQQIMSYKTLRLTPHLRESECLRLYKLSPRPFLIPCSCRSDGLIPTLRVQNDAKATTAGSESFDPQHWGINVSRRPLLIP